jgi:hypothetical protein
VHTKCEERKERERERKGDVAAQAAEQCFLFLFLLLISHLLYARITITQEKKVKKRLEISHNFLLRKEKMRERRTASSRLSPEARMTSRILLPLPRSISSLYSLRLVVAMSCLLSSVFVSASGGEIPVVTNKNAQPEKVTRNFREDLRARVNGVHRNVIDCNACVRVNRFLHTELVEMEREEETTSNVVDTIESEEELAKHHAKELKTRKRKLLHGRSEPKIRDTLLHACMKCSNYDVKRRYDLQDSDCDACNVILFGSKERGRILLEGKDGQVEVDERRMDRAFHALVDHTFELGTPGLHEMVDFLCVPHFCQAEEAEQQFPGDLAEERHEEL